MFGLVFRFPAGRYHATPWGRNVNEADVAWPPEPWRILRALVASYWRKGDRERWDREDLARLVETLARDLPLFHLPEGAIHAHTRHYMPIRKGKGEGRTLVFDAFLHLPEGAEVVVTWPDTSLNDRLLALTRDLADGIGYLGRAESWAECRIVSEAAGEPNCVPAESGATGDLVRMLAPRSSAGYLAERRRLLRQEEQRIRENSVKMPTERQLRQKVASSFRAAGGRDTLPELLLDALSLETADLQSCGWVQPPAAHEAIYARSPDAAPGVIPRVRPRIRKEPRMSQPPTVARYLVAGRPRPRIEDAVKIGEVMRSAALSKFGWDTDEATGKRLQRAPWQISGRGEGNRPLRDPTHPHAFWLPEDADDDGWIDHIVVYVDRGMDRNIRSHLDRITRIWLGQRPEPSDDPGVNEWRLALEGFGRRKDFEGGSRILASSRRWRSLTPFLAPGHLKKAGHAGEVRRLLQRRGYDTEGVTVDVIDEIEVGGTPRRALNFHRFRSQRRERQHDSSGVLLEIEFPAEVQGPLALGYGSHFGLGMFGVR